MGAGRSERPNLVGLPSLPAGAHNLPRATSTFVGRRAELKRISELLATDRVVTVTGPSGMGKTRLAAHVASRLAPSLADGVWFVELALLDPTDEPNVVAGAVASALEVRPQPGQSYTDALVARLRKASLLVVLDNCEHLVGAATALVGDLLDSCHGLSVLATSQQALGAAGERTWPLGPLSLPGPGRTGAGSDAVALFHSRAKSINPNFDVTEQGAAAVADICKRLDGIPLAIELAAARTNVLSPIEIHEHLDDHFALLTVGGPSDVPRHQTLQAALDWSWGLLSGEEKILLRRLSIFAGGAGLADVRAVCTGNGIRMDAVVDLLGSLVSKSLVVAETARTRARYTLLETIRAYGRRRLDEAGEAAEVGELHAEWFAEQADGAWHQLVDAAEERGADAVEEQHDNLRAALTWFVARSDGQAALAMASALTPFWKVRGHFRTGRDWLQRSLSLGHQAPAALRVRGLWGLGLLATMQGDVDSATTALEESLALARQHGYERPAAEALHLLAFISVFTRDPLNALPLLDETVGLARSTHDTGSLVSALALYGRAHLFAGDLTGSEKVFEECRELDSASGRGGTEGLVGLGWVALSRGHHHRAQRLLDDALPLVRRDGDRFEIALVQSFLGELAWRAGDHEHGRSMLEDGADLARAIGAPFPLSRCLLGLALVAHGAGDERGAVALVGDAVDAARRARFPFAIVRCLLVRAELAAAAGDLQVAQRCLAEARELAAANGDRAGLAHSLRPLAALARLEGDFAGAAAALADAVEAHAAIGDVGGLADALEAMASLALDQDRADHGARLFGAAHAIRAEHGSLPSPTDRSAREADEAKLRAALGPEEFDRAFGRGASMSLNDAVGFATRSRSGRARPTEGWAALTPAEREVVELAADGLTNPEIAEKLFISPRTVQGHLARVYRKLGILSRRELREAHRTRS